mgnify:CR=1 FL=1
MMSEATNLLSHNWGFAFFLLGVFGLIGFMLGVSSLLGGKACFDGHLYWLSHLTPTYRHNHRTQCGRGLAPDGILSVDEQVN